MDPEPTWWNLRKILLGAMSMNDGVLDACTYGGLSDHDRVSFTSPHEHGQYIGSSRIHGDGS